LQIPVDSGSHAGFDAHVQAQESYPVRPIRIIVANPAGGVGDVTSRNLGEHAGKLLSTNLFVDSRPSASTTIGTPFGARRCGGSAEARGMPLDPGDRAPFLNRS
jgi:hypothetical protein